MVNHLNSTTILPRWEGTDRRDSEVTTDQESGRSKCGPCGESRWAIGASRIAVTLRGTFGTFEWRGRHVSAVPQEEGDPAHE